MLNWIVRNGAVLYAKLNYLKCNHFWHRNKLCQGELFEIEKNWYLTECKKNIYTYTKLNCWNRSVWLNWISWNRNVFLQLNCVLMLNWCVWNRTLY